MKRTLILSALLAAVAPAIGPAAAPAVAAAPAARPAVLDASAREAYRGVFAALDRQQWEDARIRLDAIGDGVLSDFARAELYLAKGSPKVGKDALVALLARAPALPQAAQLLALAKKRGADPLPEIVAERELVSYRGAPRRLGATPAQDAAAMQFAAVAKPLVQTDRPSDAEAALNAALPTLGPDAQAEWQQRIAWAYYLAGDDPSAMRLAAQATQATCDWATQASWVGGLAAWRSRAYDAAAAAFAYVATRARDDEMRAAGLFWAARADMASGHPERVQSRLRTAARLPETFYGLLAGQALGKAMPAPAPVAGLSATEWQTLSAEPNVRIAAALVEVGELGLADEALRHQARIGPDGGHGALLRLAAALDLPATQIWLAHNAPAGARPDLHARYPAPGWTPQGGWRVDKSLVFAHALQESLFRTNAQSLAGARGVLQVLPSTAELIERKRGSGVVVDKAALFDPSVNMDYGQSYLEQLRDASGTGGLLPKVIAAYNAGPGNVVKWNLIGRDRGDPLLYIESIPYWETRAYVALVLRNYWMYQQEAGKASPSLKAMAQLMWPRFPGMPGATAMRVDPVRGASAAD